MQTDVLELAEEMRETTATLGVALLDDQRRRWDWRVVEPPLFPVQTEWEGILSVQRNKPVHRFIMCKVSRP